MSFNIENITTKNAINCFKDYDRAVSSDKTQEQSKKIYLMIDDRNNMVRVNDQWATGQKLIFPDISELAKKAFSDHSIPVEDKKLIFRAFKQMRDQFEAELQELPLFQRAIAKTMLWANRLGLTEADAILKQAQTEINTINEVKKYPGPVSVTNPLKPVIKNEQTLNITRGGDTFSGLEIEYPASPGFDVTVRAQNIFESGAQVIVNAANTTLSRGGGIDGAIHRFGGTAYANEHLALQQSFNSTFPSGYASMIESGNLRESHQIEKVIVVAGPSVEEGAAVEKQQKDELYSCFYNSLILANQEGDTSIAFPAISSGIFGFPLEEAAPIFIRAVSDFIENSNARTTLKTISLHVLPT